MSEGELKGGGGARKAFAMNELRDFGCVWFWAVEAEAEDPLPPLATLPLFNPWKASRSDVDVLRCRDGGSACVGFVLVPGMAIFAVGCGGGKPEDAY